MDSDPLIRLMTGPQDSANAFLKIHAGAGGTECQDWAEMLHRMYGRWARRRGMGMELMDCLEGDHAGFRSVTVRVAGRFAYGFLRHECGVHRLVRLSPFDSQGRRHASFCKVTVCPEVMDGGSLEVRDRDPGWETWSSSRGDCARTNEEIIKGGSIRSYVLHPYQLVRDHRTGHATESPATVMDGNLDGFMEASLRSRTEGGNGGDELA